MPLQQSPRALAQVHGDVPDAAPKATHHFHFSVGRMLEMQAPHGPDRTRARVVDLFDVATADGIGQIALTEQPRKRPTVVLESVRFRNENACNGCWKEFHASPSSRCFLTWPPRRSRRAAGG